MGEAMNTTRKGTAWSRQVHQYLEALGFHVERRAWMDTGDDMTATGHGVLLSIENKSARAYRFGDWLDQARSQVRAVGSIPVVVAKRNGRGSVGEGFVVMSVSDFGRLFEEEG